MRYAAYAAHDKATSAAAPVHWIGHDGNMSGLLQALWLSARQGSGPSPIACRDAEAIPQGLAAAEIAA